MVSGNKYLDPLGGIRFMMLKLLFILFSIFTFSLVCNAQIVQSETYNEVIKQRRMSIFPISKWDSLRCAWFGECIPSLTQQPTSINNCPLAIRMFGWHAIGSTSSSYQWGLMSDLSYFSYQVDAVTGNAINSTQIAAFPSDPVVIAANANNVRVSLCANLFNNSTEFSTFFGSIAAQNTLISNLISSVISANGKGINIDFEGSGLGTTYLSQFLSFMNSLSTQLHAAIPNSELSIDLQGTYANSSSLLTGLIPYVNLFILMGYDYYWNGQFYPGPVAPSYQFPAGAGDPNGHGNVSNDLNNLIRYVGTSKTILAMPYYGRRWKTTNGCVIPATGNAASISTQTYTQFRQNSNGYYSNTLREVNTFNAYHCFTDVNAIPNEEFIDDSISLQKKYDIIRQRGIAGAAVWRLGYDAGYNECWNLVNNNLSTCSVTPLTDTIYDMGGPTGNYHNNENYTFTVSPPGATAIKLTFLSFDLELNYDSLIIYDGTSTTATIIGRFTGNTLPPSLISSSGSITMRFHSDGATTKPGFKAYYTTYVCASLRKTIASGNWNDPAIWECGLPPSFNDSVEISAGNSISLPVSAQVKYIKIKFGASLSVNDSLVTFTIGNISNRSSMLGLEGSLNITGGHIIVYGNLVCSGNYIFLFSSGKLIIDGNTGVASKSVADGQYLFDCPPTAMSFNFSGGLLQIINPPLGTSSEAINCSYSFGIGSTLQFGDGISTTSSNNVNGFGGYSFPTEIGILKLDAATLINNRVLRIVKPLFIRTSCEVASGIIVQAALLNLGY